MYIVTPSLEYRGGTINISTLLYDYIYPLLIHHVHPLVVLILPPQRHILPTEDCTAASCSISTKIMIPLLPVLSGRVGIAVLYTQHNILLSRVTSPLTDSMLEFYIYTARVTLRAESRSLGREEGQQ